MITCVHMQVTGRTVKVGDFILFPTSSCIVLELKGPVDGVRGMYDEQVDVIITTHGMRMISSTFNYNVLRNKKIR